MRDLYEVGDERRRIANLIARFDLLTMEEYEELAGYCLHELGKTKEVLTAISNRNPKLSFTPQNNFITDTDYRKAKIRTSRPTQEEEEDGLTGDAYRARLASVRNMMFAKQVPDTEVHEEEREIKEPVHE